MYPSTLVVTVWTAENRHSRVLGADRETGLPIWTSPHSYPQAWVTFPALHPCMHKHTNTQKYSVPTANSTTHQGPWIPQQKTGVGRGEEGRRGQGRERQERRDTHAEAEDVQIERQTDILRVPRGPKHTLHTLWQNGGSGLSGICP